MIKRRLISLFLFTITINIFQLEAQVSVDSQYVELYKLARIAQNNLQRNVLDSLAEEIIALGSSVKNEEYVKYGLFFKAESMVRKDPKVAIEAAQESLEFFLDIKDHGKCSRIYNTLGHCFSNIGEHRTAIEKYNLAIEQSKLSDKAEERSEKRFRAGTNYNIGYTLMRQGETDEAATYLYNCLDYAKANKDSVIEYAVLVQIGNISLVREEYSQALQHFRRSIRLAEPTQPNGVVFGLMGIAGVYNETFQIDSAKFYYELVNDLNRKSKNVTSLCLGLDNLSELYYKSGEIDRSIQTSHELLDLSESSGMSHFHVNAYINLCKCHLQKEEYSLASSYVSKGVDMLNDDSEFYKKKYLYSCAAEVEEAQGKYKSALQYERLHKQYSDSILNAESVAQINDLEVLYKTNEKELKINELESQNELAVLRYNQNILLLVAGLALALLGGTVLFFYSKRKRLIAEQQKNKLESKLLRTQMNPHFIFNAISSIQNYLFDKSDLKLALHYLSKFSELMRQILENSREEYVSLNTEISALENYLELQQLRYNNSFGYELEIDAQLNKDEIMVPPMIAQPFVENAIEHGMIYRVENGKVRIKIHGEGDLIILTIQDNGLGSRQVEVASKHVNYKKKSLATAMTKERLEYISGISKRQLEFVIESVKSGGTLVIIQLPKIKMV